MSPDTDKAQLTPAVRSSDVEEFDRSIRPALLAAIVDSSDDAIVSKTLEGRILSWNAGATRIFGYRPDEVIGKPITIIIPPELHEEEQRILRKLRQGECIAHFDTVRVTKDGRRIPISLSVSPVRDSRGVVVAASKIARDISERKRAEEALRQSEEALRQADCRKNEFLASLAHELRNTLAPIRYALATAKKSERTPEQQRTADQVVERQVAHMSRLLDDLLDISRITYGILELKKRATTLRSVVGSAIETARPLLDARRHTLTVDLPDQPTQLQADPVRLAQVFSNLLINAAQYTDPGGHIELSATREENEIVVAVRDNGIGLSAEMMPRVFTLFARAQTARDRAEGGLGIGLALVQGLVRLHGGSVAVRSAGPGSGTEFTVRLPVEAPGVEFADPEQTDDAAASTPLKILVVDDNRDAADTCAMLLELSGHQVQTAYSASGALELGETFRPDALLLDIGLPDLDGYQLAQRVRATPWGRRAALIAVTGWGHEEDRRQAFAAGFDRHLTKPIAPEMLASLLRELGSAAGSREEGRRSRPSSNRTSPP